MYCILGKCCHTAKKVDCVSVGFSYFFPCASGPLPKSPYINPLHLKHIFHPKAFSSLPFFVYEPFIYSFLHVKLQECHLYFPNGFVCDRYSMASLLPLIDHSSTTPANFFVRKYTCALRKTTLTSFGNGMVNILKTRLLNSS